VEKVEVSAFSVQEFIISGIYLYETRKILKTSTEVAKYRVRRVMYRLIYINITMVLLDIAVIVLQYVNRYEVQVTFKDAAYSLKLKLELVILNQLKEISSSWTLPSESLSVGWQPYHPDYNNLPVDHSLPDDIN
jgi:hypothetical protein